MRLLELRANKKSFNTVHFKPEGISIIAAIKKTEEQRKTYNSVGKSLTITLIHFCLASNRIPEFDDKLKDWIFTLEFQIEDKIYTSSRSTSQQDKIILNQETLSLDQFKKKFGDELFLIPDGSKYISFRGLINRFIRARKSSYVNYDTYIDMEQGLTKEINNGFLLGLDIKRILKKNELKQQHDKIKEQIANIEKNEVIKSYFQGDSDEDIEIKVVELESTIKQLSNSINTFKIADDYDNIRKEADQISSKLRRIKNQATKLQSVIKNIDRSLKYQPDVTSDKIKSLYKEAKFQLGEAVIKRLDELENFNNKLLNNRNQKLLEEKNKFEIELNRVTEIIQKLGGQEDEKLQYLNTHGALEEYTQLNRQLTDNEKKLEKLVQYKKMLRDFKNQLQKNKQEFSSEVIRTNQYLDKIDTLIKGNIMLFKSFTEYFYEGKSSGITVENNENINKKRFEIIAKIEDDAGDAVNEVKIFCFDWTILKAQHNHKVKFIFHDSRITDGMDPRQIKSMFELADKETKKYGYQYIISLNQNVIDNLKEEMTPDTHLELIENNIVLSLSDRSSKEKLLGMQIDLNYGE